MRRGAVLITALSLLALLAACGGSSQPESNLSRTDTQIASPVARDGTPAVVKDDSTEMKIRAFNECILAIKRTFQPPAKVYFPPTMWDKFHAEIRPPRTYLVWTYVDVEGASGEELRTHFMCEYEPFGTRPDRYSVTKVVQVP